MCWRHVRIESINFRSNSTSLAAVQINTLHKFRPPASANDLWDTKHTLHAAPTLPSNAHTQMWVYLTRWIMPKSPGAFLLLFFFCVGYMMCSWGEEDTTQAFDTALSSTLLLVSSSSSHNHCEPGHSLQQEVSPFHLHTHTYTHPKGAQAYGDLCKGIHTSSRQELEPAVSLVKRGCKPPGVWPLLLLSSPRSSPILLTSLPPSLSFTHTFLILLSTSPFPFWKKQPCSLSLLRNAATYHYLSCATSSYKHSHT